MRYCLTVLRSNTLEPKYASGAGPWVWVRREGGEGYLIASEETEAVVGGEFQTDDDTWKEKCCWLVVAAGALARVRTEWRDAAVVARLNCASRLMGVRERADMAQRGRRVKQSGEG